MAQPDSEFTVQGRVVNNHTGQGVEALRVEAWDKDTRSDDALGTAQTDSRGFFTITFRQRAFQVPESGEEPLDRMPDVYFRIYYRDQLLKSTEESVIWNLEEEDDDVTIEVDYPPGETPEPYLLPTVSGEDAPELKLDRTGNPAPQSTLGAIDLAVSVNGPDEFPETYLAIPYDRKQVVGIDLTKTRIFRWDEDGGTFRPLWKSGVNQEFGYIWSSIRRSGVYIPLGLPRDRLLQHRLRALAYARQVQSSDADSETARDLTRQYFKPFLEEDTETLERVRENIARLEIQTSPHVSLEEINFGQGGHPGPFHLPRGESLQEIRARLEEMEIPPGGLPEEDLFRSPERLPPGGLPWPVDPDVGDLDLFDRIPNLQVPPPWKLPPWVFSTDWPMYQHDERHTGHASGPSSIDSSTVSQLAQRHKVNLDGPVNSKPSIEDGKVYVGTTQYTGGSQGTLYKIDLSSGNINGKFPTNDPAHYPISGIGGSPAIHNGKVYFTTVGGSVYCVETATMTTSPPHPSAVWETDLTTPDAGQNQPVSNPDGDCWSSPLVVNGKVYVGSGEGEGDRWGFIWCLDAQTGEVIWLFCTNKAQDIGTSGNENQPNEIPRSAAVSDPLPAWASSAGFSLIDDPPERGSSPWSSFAYDHVNQQVYVGTGNTTKGDVAPDERYGSGLIALDANTGQFRGFHTPQPDDSYLPSDADIDVPGAPTVFTRNGQRVVCYGSKNGSFFLLDASNLDVLGGGSQRRQLIARKNGTGHPGNRGQPAQKVATQGSPGENKYGVMATPAIHSGKGNIYVGLGGYQGARGGTKTPFIRALDWNNLNDAWPTGPPGPNGIVRYSMATPPVYNREEEAALSSPAVVNDVVFVSTTDPQNSEMRLFALDADTGFCLWAAPTVSGGGWPKYALGPAISGEYVAAGAGDSLYIYARPSSP